MRLLLDTHTVLWFWWDDPRLSGSALETILNPTNQKFVSLATPWEVAIKVSLKKLDVGGPPGDIFQRYMPKSRFAWYPIRRRQVNVLATLPFHHKDPFDRMIVAQALAEGIPIVSADAQLDVYGITRIW